MLRAGYISVSVATLWTSPKFPREVDAPALQANASIRHWLSQLSRENRVALIHTDAVQTQALYGAHVIIDKEENGWSHCYVPDQVTPKSNKGYPGWIPSCQIQLSSTYDQQYDKAASVWVIKPSTVLYYDNDRAIVLSYLTRLPFLDLKGDKVYVHLPNGESGWLNHHDVSITPPDSYLPKQDGKKLVEAGLAFLNVPYLWSGMSGFAYDCSGFSYSIHKGNGILIPRDASAQYQYGKDRGLEVPCKALQAGDSVYFSTDNGRIDHVGIYAGSGQLLHASNSNYVVKLESLWQSRYAPHFLGAIRFWQD